MNTPFGVPILREKGVWKDYRGKHVGGFTWSSPRPLKAVNKIFIHHSVTNPSLNADKDIATVYAIHRKKGWRGIAYNIIVTSEEKNGYAICGYTGDLGTRRSHTSAVKGAPGVPKNQGNYYGIGICIIGMLHQKMPTDAQLRSCNEIVKELLFSTYEKKRFPNLGVGGFNNVLPHFTVNYTACPGMWDKYKGKILTTGTPEVEKPQIVEKINAETPKVESSNISQLPKENATLTTTASNLHGINLNLNTMNIFQLVEKYCVEKPLSIFRIKKGSQSYNFLSRWFWLILPTVITYLSNMLVNELTSHKIGLDYVIAIGTTASQITKAIRSYIEKKQK